MKISVPVTIWAIIGHILEYSDDGYANEGERDEAGREHAHEQDIQREPCFGRLDIECGVVYPPHALGEGNECNCHYTLIHDTCEEWNPGSNRLV